ncbi:uncharacterized protein F5147DRAFT_779001 [Suillus discolor]|uniref:F-box domain-containing protein n=1 Tax=Suillus discolor TaxID=1912936 RepID=A0A9P7JPA9_9AGAM|nr:uncharacterized protein F5147DRAFT_779001 [Suillus discolor]KAG2094398.1 hypothetical protein F5147DRAFT_779001 [Suillus discolor]
METTQTLGSASLVHLIPHVQTELSPMILKRKIIDDSPDSSTPPCKKRKIPQDRSTRKAYTDTPDGSIPPSPKRRTLSRSYAIADLAVHSETADLPRTILKERSKRKAYTDTPDGSLPPSPKRRTLSRSYAIADLAVHSGTVDLPRTILKERSKRKAYTDTPDGSLPPSPKRRTRSRSYTIADLTTRPTEERSPVPFLSRGTPLPAVSLTGQAICSHWPFPNELTLMIFQYLPAADLRSITQVSVLSMDLAAPIYLHSIGLHVERTWLQVNTQTCLALPLYSRTSSFCVPRFLRCDLHGTGDHDLAALKIFLQSLKGVQSKPISSVMCFDAPPGVDLASLFQLVKDLGCFSFSYSSSDTEDLCTIVPAPVSGSNSSAICHLRRLSVDSHMFFSPCVASLTLATLRDSPLTDLSLTHTGLNGIQWAALLRNVHLPLLRMFTVDIECPPDVLAEFLIRHQNVGQLWIHPGQNLFPPKSQNHSLQKLSRQTSQQIDNSRVLHLNVLGGPPWYLTSLLATIHSAPCIRNLNLRFDEDLTSNRLSAVLDVTQHFSSIQVLQLSFFDAPHYANHFDFPCNERRTVPAKQLTISVHGPDPDGLLFHCRPWLDAFHELESVELRAKHTNSLERLKILFSCPDHPFQLEISSSDF